MTALAAMTNPQDPNQGAALDVYTASPTTTAEAVEPPAKPAAEDRSEGTSASVEMPAAGSETKTAAADAKKETAVETKPVKQAKRADAPPVPQLSKTERSKAEQCLALNIYHEARSEAAAGQRAVAAVTLNRVASRSFPNSVCKVVKQGGKRRNKCQFSWWCDKKSDKPRERKAWKRALELSRMALKGQFADPTKGALYYHANHVKPRWARTFKRTSRIGRHLFYKPRGA